MMDGALCLNMGKLKMSLSQPVQTSETNWNMDASEIQIKFARGSSGIDLEGVFDDSPNLDALPRLGEELIIVRESKRNAMCLLRKFLLFHNLRRIFYFLLT